jgi:hypothetical protein
MILSGLHAARPLRAADEALSSIIRRRLDKALAARDLHDSGPLSGRVRQLMVKHLGETTLTPETVARTLAVSRRTLGATWPTKAHRFATFSTTRAGNSHAPCCRIAV